MFCCLKCSLFFLVCFFWCLGCSFKPVFLHACQLFPVLGGLTYMIFGLRGWGCSFTPKKLENVVSSFF